jgi:hypothetical protein
VPDHPWDVASSRTRVFRDVDEVSRVTAYLPLLLERFPHVRAEALKALARHATFRELCEEYVACTEAAERLARTGSDEAIREEYSALRLRVESELLRYIAEHGGSGAAGE